MMFEYHMMLSNMSVQSFLFLIFMSFLIRAWEKGILCMLLSDAGLSEVS